MTPEQTKTFNTLHRENRELKQELQDKMKQIQDLWKTINSNAKMIEYASLRIWYLEKRAADFQAFIDRIGEEVKS